MPHHIVMVDDDETTLLLVARAIEQRNPRLRFTTFSDPAAALQAINLSPPELLVTDFRMPSLNGMELVLVARQRRPDLPVVLISSYGTPELRREIESQGGIVFLEKPVQPEVVEEQIVKLLANQRSFAGQVRITLLPDLLQIFSLSRESGALEIRRGRRQGTIWLYLGEVVHCACGSLEGEEAFREILKWQGGEFHLRPTEATPARTIRTSLQSLLLDSLRQLDEESRGDGSASATGERAVEQLREQARRSPLSAEAAIVLTSLRENRSWLLQGEPGTPIPALRPWMIDLVGAARPLDAVGESGHLKTIDGARGWALAWNRRLGLAVLVMQELRAPGALELFRTCAGDVVSWLR